MGTANKWSGSLGKSGDSASGGKGVQGSNVYKAPPTSPQPMAKTGTSQNVVTMRTGPGDNMGTQAISSHNNINAFTRGIKSRGPYGGPQFSSFNTTKQNMQRSDTTSISKFTTPSTGSSSRGSTGGSGRGMTKNSKVGSGQAVASKGKLARDVHKGSGHQAGLGRARG
jgi:hypothetical protein